MLSTQLKEKYGSSFALRNLRRMMQFAEQFPDFEIVSTSSTLLSWSHFIEILPLKTFEAKLYYLDEAKRGLVSVEKMREMIKRKAFERKEIADTQISSASPIPTGIFKDPYLFDVLSIFNFLQYGANSSVESIFPIGGNQSSFFIRVML